MVTTQNTQTRTTAPVVRFICLYTHDLKRKNKRWKDGRLEFHTFNRRVMVYDEGGNFVGDSHRTRSHEVDDGDEFQLDRGNVIVQVSERVGQRDQDITEIVARKPKAQQNSTPNATGVLTPRTRPPSSNMRHLSLQSLLSTPGRQLGRAVIPTTSPFERRNQTPDDHASKRRRLDTAQRNDQPSTTAIFDSSPCPPRHSTTPVSQEASKRKRFSPPRVRNAPPAPAPANKTITLNSAPVTKSNPARSERNGASALSGAENVVIPSDEDEPTTEFHRPADSPTRRRINATKYKFPTMKRDLLPGKENRGAVASGGKQDAPSGGRQTATGRSVSKPAPVDRPAEPRQPDEPMTALRLGSAQKRGLLIAKPPVKGKRQDKPLAQPANGRAHVAAETMAYATSALEGTPVTDTGQRVANPALPVNSAKESGGQPAVVGPRTEKPAAKSGPWSREASDLLDYKRRSADKPAA